MVRQRRQKFRTLLIVLFVSVEQRRGAPDFYFLVATSCCKSTSIRVRVDGINRSRTVVRDEGWFVYQHHFCRSHESLPRATPAAPSRERARAVWWFVPIRVACDIFKYFEIETDPFSLFFEVSGRVRLCRLLCVVVRRFQMPTHHGRDLFFERNKMTRVDSFLNNNLVLTTTDGDGFCFFLFFFCVVCPQKVYSSLLRERVPHTHTPKVVHTYHTIPSIRSIDRCTRIQKSTFFCRSVVKVVVWSSRPQKKDNNKEREKERERKNQSRFCAKETHESSSSSSSVRLDDAWWRRRRGEVSESSDENNEATRTARLFFEMARDDDDDDEWRYVSNASTRRT